MKNRCKVVLMAFKRYVVVKKSSWLSFFVGYKFYGANKTGWEHKMPNESNAITWGQPPGQDFQMSLQSKKIGQV